MSEPFSVWESHIKVKQSPVRCPECGSRVAGEYCAECGLLLDPDYLREREDNRRREWAKELEARLDADTIG
jgi:DNA-directed RNA polymerase subunit RPC12/RpoP